MGEIVMSGDLVMTGYYKMPDKTAKTIIDGWLHIGDIGYIDSRGYVFIKDRIRDVVITGGFNVYPSDVEAVLGRHTDIRESEVFGVADAKWGEAVHAAVELHDGRNHKPGGHIQICETTAGFGEGTKGIAYYPAPAAQPGWQSVVACRKRVIRRGRVICRQLYRPALTMFDEAE